MKAKGKLEMVLVALLEVAYAIFPAKRLKSLRTCNRVPVTVIHLHYFLSNSKRQAASETVNVLLERIQEQKCFEVVVDVEHRGIKASGCLDP